MKSSQIVWLLYLVCAFFLNPVFAQDDIGSFRNWKIGKGNTNDKLALIIGNSSYLYNESLLEPEKDARVMSAALFKQGVHVSEAYNLGRDQMESVIQEFAQQLKGYQTGIIFYAGHGFQVDGKNYLVPVDADPKKKSDIAVDCIDLEGVLNKINDGSKSKIIILDACRNNPFKGNWSGSEFRGGNAGFAGIDNRSNTKFIYSTAVNTMVFDRNPFAEELAKEIAAGGCFDDIFRNVLNSLDSINRRNKTSQEPWSGGNLRQKICFGEIADQSDLKKRREGNGTEGEISPDQDGDGVADHLDDCILIKGPIEYNGCPISDLTTWLEKIERMKTQGLSLDRELGYLRKVNSITTNERLAYLYFNDDLATTNLDVRLLLLRESAKKGDGLAAYQLGLLYGKGIGVPKSSVQYKHWIEFAAKKRNVWVQRKVAHEFYSGKVLAVNPKEAFKWMLEAARAGYPPAQNDLGDFYKEGIGVNMDITSSGLWYSLSAEQGFAQAQFNLGMCYIKGEGLVKDLAEGKTWMEEAAKQGHKEAKKELARH